MQFKPRYNGGGFAEFRSYYDYRLPPSVVGPLHTDDKQFKLAFEEFMAALHKNPKWRERFSGEQVCAIEAAIAANGPRIHGFVWHHHEDHGVLQLVLKRDHEQTPHYGGRFTTGGRP